MVSNMKRTLIAVAVLLALLVGMTSCGLFVSDKTPQTTPSATGGNTPETTPQGTSGDPATTPSNPGTTDPTPATTPDPSVTTKDPSGTTADPKTTEPNTNAPHGNKDPQPATSDITKTGTIYGMTETNLKLIVDWTAVQKKGSTTMEVTCKVSLQHRNMYKSPSGGSITLNGKTQDFKSPLIDALDNKAVQTNELGTVSFILNHNQGEKLDLDFACKWYYGGVYSDVNIQWIEANATTSIQ